ncbi:MAG: purine-binding chemotaxis protein CheW [Gammaproteobacteria bacterium (ex Lamellibrachia satsuma)]|nr:MAG: purine-binding chemotaxis protein CheW [Gammaproteobacteria bacterium (ex Lamellibrachia satsuma)]
MAEMLSDPMFDDPEELVQLLQVIEHRSREFARGLPQQEQAEAQWEGVMFFVGEQRLVAPLDEIKEILNYPSNITPVPGTKSWMLGVANVRGNLIPVIDLQSYLVGNKTDRGRRSRVLVFAHHDVFTGVLVGEMVGMRHFSETMAIANHGVVGHMEKYVRFGFDLDGEVWPVLSLFSLAQDPAFQVAAV